VRRKGVRIGLWGLFALLILAGMLIKRIWGHPELTPVFHVTALLVLIGISLTAERRPVTGQTTAARPSEASRDADPSPQDDGPAWYEV